MTPSGCRRMGCGIGLLGLAVVTIVPNPFCTIIWDGGFESVEYRLAFTDETGRLVPGVRLRVLTQGGGVSHLYPVDEFLPDRVPTSDAQGRMVFRHTSEGLEFGGRSYGGLLGGQFGEAGAPQYLCIFLVGDQEVHRMWYADLRGGDPYSLPPVSRVWRVPDWPPREYAAHRNNWLTHRPRLFDGNRDGQLDREERTAAGYFERVVEQSYDDRKEREVTYYVIEQTVLISVP